jgi:hypothetical protein
VCARADLGEIAEDEAPRAASDAQGRVRLEVRPSDQSPHQGRNGALPEDQWTLEIAFGGPRQETRRESFLFTAGAATAVGTIALRPGGELLGRLVLRAARSRRAPSST